MTRVAGGISETSTCHCDLCGDVAMRTNSTPLGILQSGATGAQVS